VAGRNRAAQQALAALQTQHRARLGPGPSAWRCSCAPPMWSSASRAA
jgi:hypothetical protein